MANIYDKVIGTELQPLDWNFIAKMKEHGALKKEKDAEEAFKLQSLIGNLKSATFDRPFKEQLDQEYFPLINNIADKLQKGDNSYKNDLIQTKVKLSTDPRIQTLAYNYNTEQKALKDMEELQKSTTVSLKPWNNEIHKFVKNRPQNQLTPFDYQGTKSYFDPTDDAQKVVASIAETELSSKGARLDKDSNGQLTGFIINHDGTKGILDDKRLDAILQASVPLFDRTKGGDSFHDELSQGYGIQDPKDLFKHKYAFLKAAALKQLHTTGGGYDLGQLSEHLIPKNTGKDITTSPSLIISNPIDLSKEQELLDDAAFDVSGNLSLEVKPRSGLTIKYKGADGQLKEIPAGSATDTRRQTEAKQLVDKLKQEQPSIAHYYTENAAGELIQGKALSDKEILTTWINAKTRLNEVSSKKFNPSPSALDDLTKKFFGTAGLGDLQNRKISVVRENGSTTPGDWETAMEELGYSDGKVEPKSFKAARVTGILPISNSPGDFVITLPDKDNKPRQMLVSGDSETQRIFRTSNSLYNLISKGHDGSFKDYYNPNISFTVNSIIDPVTKMFTPVIRITDKSTGEEEYTTLEQVIEQEKKDYMNSGYVGTQIQNQNKEKP